VDGIERGPSYLQICGHLRMKIRSPLLRHNGQREIVKVATFVTGLESIAANRDCPAVGKIAKAPEIALELT